DLSRFEWMAYLFVNVDDDSEKAKSELAGFLGGTYSQDFRAFVDRVAVAGTPDEVTGRIQQYVDAGARHLIFSVGTRVDRVAMARRILREVTPKLKITSA